MIELGAGLGYAFGPAIGGYLYLVHMALHIIIQSESTIKINFLDLVVQAGGYLTPFIVVGGLCLICLIPSMLLISTTSKLFIDHYIILSSETCNNISEKKRQLIRLKVLAKLLNSLILFLLCKYVSLCVPCMHVHDS